MTLYTQLKLVAAALLLTNLWGCDSAQQETLEPGPTEVEVVTLKAADVVLTSVLPGRATALRTAEIRPQVSGIIVKRLFREGAEIEAGAQLYQIDDALYRAAHATAQAQLAQAKANLAAAQAREARYKDLLGKKAVSQQDYDDAQASFLQAQAAQQGAEAAVETSRINLEYTKVLAPISGRIGKSMVTEGALATANQVQALATIQQFDPIYVDVSQSVSQLMDIRRQMTSGGLVDDPSLPVRLTLDDGTRYEHEGVLEFSEVDVNESTGTVVLRALFPNPDHFLLPGMFVRTEIAEGRRPNALLIPQRAVSHNRQGHATTLVVTEESTVELRELQTGRAVGDHWLALSGVEAGEKVIVAGLQKVEPGAQVSAVTAEAADETDVASMQAEEK